MKKLIFPIIASVLLMSCGNNETVENEIEDPIKEEQESESGKSVFVSENSEKDPICDMVRTDEWTDYTVEGEDTVWFCSHVCKGAYDAHSKKEDKPEEEIAE